MRSSEHIDHLLQYLLDGELDAEEAAAARRHLEVCERCRREWAAQQAVAAGVRSLPRSIEPPSNLWAGIAARIREAVPVDQDRASEAVPVDRGSTGEAVPVDRDNADDAVPANSDARENVPSVDGKPDDEATRRRRALRPGTARGDRPDRLAGHAVAAPSRRRRRVGARILAAGLVLAAAAAVVWLLTRGGGIAWDVEPLGGAPRVAQVEVDDRGTIHPGQWLETDEASRARLRIGTIGEVDVDPNTRIQLKRAQITDHRIALAEGRIEARIWAPPRLFFVETPSATAIDLGCAYTLDVDSTGRSILHVTSGYVELEREGKSSVVPAGAMCYATPAAGPGTVFSEDASPALREALERYDFAGSHASDLDIILAEARSEDAMTLWQLVERSDGVRRATIYRRLADLVDPPIGATPEGIMEGDEAMFQMWRMHLGLDAMGWWGYLRGKLSFPD